MSDKRDTEEFVEEEEGFGGEGGRVEKRRRLSVDQVKSLERIFEEQNKLEAERKSRLAEELGLQPKQVAIWFQNRRARWKSKQLERDYGVLKSGYDSLKADYDCLDHENKSLLSQLAELKRKLKQRTRAAANNPDNECPVVAVEECPISEPVVTKPEVGHSSEIDTLSRSSNTLVKDQEEKEDSSPNTNLLKVEMGAVTPPMSTMEPGRRCWRDSQVGIWVDSIGSGVSIGGGEAGEDPRRRSTKDDLCLDGRCKNHPGFAPSASARSSTGFSVPSCLTGAPPSAPAFLRCP